MTTDIDGLIADYCHPDLPMSRWADRAFAALAAQQARIAELKRLLTPALELTGWGLLLTPPIKHGRACAFVTKDDGTEWRAEDADCTCGYEWRIRCADYMTAYNAWRKRATEAEAALRQAVPREATEAMINATGGLTVYSSGASSDRKIMARVWRAMYDAAQASAKDDK